MKTFTTFAATAAVAILALAATDLSAAAQAMTNGPNKLRSKTMAGRQPSRMMMKSHRTMHRKTSFRYGHQPMHYVSARPLVVRPTAPVVVAAPVAGPGTLVTGPLAFGSDIAALPFRGLGAIFPATGDVASNPLILIGGPLHAAGELAQIPFRLIGAPFGGTPIATY